MDSEYEQETEILEKIEETQGIRSPGSNERRYPKKKRKHPRKVGGKYEVAQNDGRKRGRFRAEPNPG
jgi:hypothetical protein